MPPRQVILRPLCPQAFTLVQPFSQPLSNINKRTVLGRSRPSPRDEGGQTCGLGFHPSGSGAPSSRLSSRLGPTGAAQCRIQPLRFVCSSGRPVPLAINAARQPGPSPPLLAPAVAPPRRPGDLRRAITTRPLPAPQPSVTAPQPFFPPAGADVWIRLPHSSLPVFPMPPLPAPDTDAPRRSRHHSRIRHRKQMILRLRARAAAQPPACAGPPSRTPTALLVTPLVDPPPLDPSAPTPAPTPPPAPTFVAIPCAQPRSDTALLALNSRAAWAARTPLRLADPSSLRHPGDVNAGTFSPVHGGLTAVRVDSLTSVAAQVPAPASTALPATWNPAPLNDPEVMNLVYARMDAVIAARKAVPDPVPPADLITLPPSSGSTPPSP
jgi:hypothetical protein